MNEELEHYEEELAIAADEIADEMGITRGEAIDLLIKILEKLKEQSEN